MELARYANLPPRRFLIPLLPEEVIEPRDIPAIELYRLLCDLLKESSSSKRFMETSSDWSEELPSIKLPKSAADPLQIES